MLSGKLGQEEYAKQIVFEDLILRSVPHNVSCSCTAWSVGFTWGIHNQVLGWFLLDIWLVTFCQLFGKDFLDFERVVCDLFQWRVLPRNKQVSNSLCNKTPLLCKRTPENPKSETWNSIQNNWKLRVERFSWNYRVGVLFTSGIPHSAWKMNFWKSNLFQIQQRFVWNLFLMSG